MMFMPGIHTASASYSPIQVNYNRNNCSSVVPVSLSAARYEPYLSQCGLKLFSCDCEASVSAGEGQRGAFFH